MSPEAASLVRVFVSYSHVDAHYVCDDGPGDAALNKRRKLISYLQSRIEDPRVEFVVDRHGEHAIPAGSPFEQDLCDKIDAAHIAILFVSEDFASSPFIRRVELPRILDRWRNRGLQLLPILVGPTDLAGLMLDGVHFLPRNPDAAAPVKPLSDHDVRSSEWDRFRMDLRTQLERQIQTARSQPVPASQPAVVPPVAPPSGATTVRTVLQLAMRTASPDAGTAGSRAVWRLVPAAGGIFRVPRNALLRLMVKVSQNCQAAIVVEGRRAGRSPAGRRFFGESPGAWTNAPALPCLLQADRWEMIPPSVGLCDGAADPMEVWRVGLLMRVPDSRVSPVPASLDAIEKWMAGAKPVAAKAPEADVFERLEDITRRRLRVEGAARPVNLREVPPLVGWVEVHFT